MSSSETTPLIIESDLDVEVSLFDGSGVQLDRRYGGLTAHVRPGIYRVETERAGRVKSMVIEHRSATPVAASAPELRTPAIVHGAESSHAYYVGPAITLSTATTAPGLGDEPRTGHLFIFVRREARNTGPPELPSEPITVLDVNGRPLTVLGGEQVERNNADGYLAYSASAAPGIYRIRATRSHRDIAVPILPGRAAHVFVADAEGVRLDDLRIFLPSVGQEFDPRSPVGHAMEAVLDALRSPAGELPSSVAPLLSATDLDLCLGIGAAHILLRHDASDPRLEAVMERLTPHAAGCPDIAILRQRWRRRRGVAIEPITVSAPPMLRASFLTAITGLGTKLQIPHYSAIAQSARGAHHDSVWWTWSHRAWDGRWILPTVDGLLAGHRMRNPASIARTIACTVALPVATVAQTLRHIDATIPVVDHRPLDVATTSVPGYRLLEPLGRGSQGVVFHAVRERDNEPVALKVVAFTGEREQRQIALREIRAMERVDHPNLVRLVASGPLPDDSGMWLDLELCRGSVLDRLAELDAPMPIDEACRIVCGALAGLAHLHERGLVHRDVKPENLLLREDGSVAVADFGLARSAALRSTRPRAGGTARFAPPEQLVDVDKAVPASDVWSAAATLYFLLTLELPREEYADQSDLQAARDNPVIPIRQRRADLPVALAKVIDAALSPEIFRRPPDAHVLRWCLLSAVAPSWSPAADRPGRALVIGATHAPPHAALHDAQEVATLLAARGFVVDLRIDERASADAVRYGFDRLVAETGPDDSAVIYYAGHGFAYTTDAAPGKPVLSIGLASGDATAPVALALAPLLARTSNVTIITDACLIAGGAVNAPALPAVQISASGANGVALEYLDKHGVAHGALTGALVEMLRNVGRQPFSWSAILRAIRARVARRSPTQSPQLAGPAYRRPFSLTRGDNYEVRGVHELQRDGDAYTVGGGEIAGLVAGDRFAVMPPGSFAYDPAAAHGELEIERVLPTRASARLVTGTAPLPDDAVAVRIGKHGAKRPVAIAIQPVSPRFLEAIDAAPTLRVAGPGDRPIATVRHRNDELAIDDDLGPLCAHGELGRQFGRVIHQLSNLAAAQALRELEGEYGIAVDEVEIALAATVDGVLRPLPHHRAVLDARDKLSVTIANRSHRALYAHVFAIDARGGISLLSASAPTGIATEPGGAPHVLRDVGIPWPSQLPRTTPRIVDIVVIVTTAPAELSRLATRDDDPAGSGVSLDAAPQIVHPRGVSDTSLEDRFAQLRDGQLVDLRDDAREFCVAHLPLWVVPIHGELRPLHFDLEQQPLARSLARAVQAASERRLGSWVPAAADEREIAIQLFDLSLPSGFRLDAVITTQSPSGAPVLRTWRTTTASTPVFAGRVRGFVDIALFVSHDTGADLAALLAPDALVAASAVLRDPEVTSVPLALGAGAVVVHRAFDALRDASGPASPVFHTTLLAEDDLAQRHPASGVYQANAVSFALAISGPPRTR